MTVIDHDMEPLEAWRDGVTTRMQVSAMVGSTQLCIFEQFCDPGLGAPLHRHSVEEVLEVFEGEAEIVGGAERRRVGPNQSVLVPAGIEHGFRNVGSCILKIRATLAAPIFEASYQIAARSRVGTCRADRPIDSSVRPPPRRSPRPETSM